jgi:hypothetical protein
MLNFLLPPTFRGTAEEIDQVSRGRLMPGKGAIFDQNAPVPNRAHSATPGKKSAMLSFQYPLRRQYPACWRKLSFQRPGGREVLFSRYLED